MQSYVSSNVLSKFCGTRQPQLKKELKRLREEYNTLAPESWKMDIKLSLNYDA
jgi:hypothetical protein